MLMNIPTFLTRTKMDKIELKKLYKKDKKAYMREYQNNYYHTKYKDWKKKYNQLPETKKRMREYMKEYNQRPEAKLKKAQYMKKYNKRKNE